MGTALWFGRSTSLFWNVLGFLASNLSDLANLVLVLAGLLYAMMPTKAAKAEEKNWHKPLGAAFIVIGLAGFGFGLRDRIESKRQMEVMLNASRSQATTSDIALLRSVIKSGFESMINAMAGLKISQATEPIKRQPEQAKEPPTISNVAHIKVTQRPVPSTDPSAAFGLQVMIQTDTVSQPTAFDIECDGEIQNGSFFVSGQSIMMKTGEGVQKDRHHYHLRIWVPSIYSTDSDYCYVVI